jgi:subtilisin-like proprotein convertase family protein
MRMRLGVVILAALLALPLAPIACPAEARQRPRRVTQTYSNTAEIELLDQVFAADPYPSRIVVNGPKGTIRDVNLTLNGLTHTSPADLSVLLVGPRGQTAVVMTEVGGGADVSAVTLRLDDEADQELPEAAILQSGAYRPHNAAVDPRGGFGSIPPAPTPSGNTALSIFDGRSPNGAWRLFILDRQILTDVGVFAGGWELEITVKAKRKRR